MANIINIDDAYRLRLQDLFLESRPEYFNNPRKEIKRLLQINADRDVSGVYKKFKSVVGIISLLLLIPRVRKSFIKSINMVEYSKLTPDQIDLFAMCTRHNNTYKYLGKTNEDRKMMVNHLKVAKPVKKPIKCS
jgi:hypothetical protein